MSTNTAENLENEVEETTEIEVEIEEAPVEEKQEVETKVEEKVEEPEVEVEAESEAKTENSDAEIDKYSAGVQKRIDQLTKKYRDEEKAREEALQLREEAVKYAEKVKEENEKLRKSLEDNEDVLINQAKSRVEAQLAQANANYKVAYEAGDSDKLLEAQSELTRLQNEQYRISNYVPPKRGEPAPVPTEAPKPEGQPDIAKPPQRALDWADKNTWFMQDKRMTGFAYGVHEELVTKGVEPNSEQYYNEIDAAMKEAFPSKFEVVAEESAPPQPQAGNVVAPPSRTSKKPRKVKLTPSAAALAKRLGLTAEQYAAQLMKDS
tara:strand:+ start:17357 stop:18319 length:963 start_codon:yes stop_codon:yes gene_type:complete